MLHKQDDTPATVRWQRAIHSYVRPSSIITITFVVGRSGHDSITSVPLDKINNLYVRTVHSQTVVCDGHK